MWDFRDIAQGSSASSSADETPKNSIFKLQLTAPGTILSMYCNFYIKTVNKSRFICVITTKIEKLFTLEANSPVTDST